MTTMKNDAPLITVVGALSKQGRSVAQTLLSSGRFRVRALTRRVDAPEAQHLPVRSSFVLLALFYTNLIEFYPPRMEGATLVFPFYLPADCSAPFVDPLTATGPAVLEIFSNPGEYAGQSLPVIGDIITPREMVETFTRVTGRKAEYRPAYAREAFLRSFPQFAGNEAQVREILGMVEYIVEYGYYRRDRDLLWSRRVDPGTLTWERFLRATRWDGQQRSFAA
jgi:hypothetical protein